MSFPDQSFVHQLGISFERELKGFMIDEIYTLSKTEIVFVFSSGERVKSLRLITEWGSCFLFFDNEKIPKRSNAQAVFRNSFGTVIKSVLLNKDDRSFDLLCSDGSFFLFKLYGALSNVLYFVSGSAPEMFRTSIRNDAQIEPNRFEKIHVADMAESRYELKLTDGKGQIIESTVSASNACQIFDAFSHYAVGRAAFEEKKRQLTTEMSKRIERSAKNREHARQGLFALENSRSPEELGHLILAYQHAIESHVKRVEVDDFYTGSKTTIALDPNKTPIENAERYYKKAGNRTRELDELKKKILFYTQELETTQSKLEEVTAAQELRDLKSFGNAKVTSRESVPFKVFEFDSWQIWVGKNASNNDLLTGRYAKKDDLWLHARGVSGSHVIIRKDHRKEFTKQVIECGAQIAAYYSKAKGAAWVPVSYAPKKRVRKPKGAEPGQVVMEIETTIIVEPKLPE